MKKTSLLLILALLAGCSEKKSESPARQVITLTAIDPVAGELNGDSAVFRLDLGGPNNTGHPIRVLFEATGGEDTFLQMAPDVNSDGTITIPEAESKRTLVLRPRPDSILEMAEAITVKVIGCSDTHWEIGPSDSAMAIVLDGNGPVATDIDGNTYHSVLIGTQTWMLENLKTTRYVNGESAGSFAYNNDPALGEVYGRQYLWPAEYETRRLCPTGWHVPSDAEWEVLASYLGGSQAAGGKMKEAGTVHWQPVNTGATNTSGFTGLPGGMRNPDGAFSGLGTTGIWWSSTGSMATRAYARSLNSGTSTLQRINPVRESGFSVRCIHD